MKGVLKMKKMMGTEKQIAWAEKIKNTMIKDFSQDKEKLEKIADNAAAVMKIERINKALDIINNQDSAVWFIDRRSWTARDIVKEVE